MNRASRQRGGILKTIGGFLTCALFLVSITGTVVKAETFPFSPQTKIRVTIVQWIPTKGAYERWDPIGGDFLISDAGTVSLPVIGVLQVAGLDNDGLAAQIAEKLKSKIGLVETPLATVEIIDRPPVYVVGDVASPGEYKFRDGLTILQALAMSGGVFRPVGAPPTSQDRLGYAGQLKEIANSLLRSDVRIVRLEAEISGSKDMVFDPNLQSDPNAAAMVFEHEKILHVARMNELDRQSKSYAELRGLLGSEIQTLEKKVISTDEDVSSLQMQLGKIKGLVDRGIVVPARQSDLERLLRSYFSDRLDLDTSIMRARQGIAETTRSLDGLYDKQRTEVATELQAEKANQDQLKLKRDLTQTLLLDILSQSHASDEDDDKLIFTVVRRDNNEVREDVATTTTTLQPGDVVNISRGAPKPSKNDVSSVMKTTRQN
ncbi:polysaccharide biosynthesis/export family protein [Rhizobium sp. Leaf262]|uniref:polysaccharide biosynthesis/export family protein n=1 Tax=Rhizobium sp. Leaf262 TaxID=1736312 RepID=UPI000A405D53|nr:polysaccharide biosynthesis/export family protein [Rhizobium sp. Leaf262]